MMFWTGAIGVSFLWLLGLTVARFYGDFRRYSGWAEVRSDVIVLGRVFKGPSSISVPVAEGLGIGLMLGWLGQLGASVLHAQFS